MTPTDALLWLACLASGARAVKLATGAPCANDCAGYPWTTAQVRYCEAALCSLCALDAPAQ